MGEYEDRYPEAYGRDDVIERNSSTVASVGAPMPRPAPDKAATETPRPVLISQPTVRTASDIRADAIRELTASPFIDAAGIDVAVAEGGAVTLAGTINSLIAIAIAKALVSNIGGVSRVETQLRVARPAHRYDPPAGQAAR
jgi:osmotically-inducible protein OsmY